MKILVLTSSFRPNGNTYRLLSLLEADIEKAAASMGQIVSFETIRLAEKGIQYCHGCRACFDKGETFCPYWADIAPIKAAMQAADIWILASPVYVDDINGVMKTFLDRMAHVNHRPEFAGKSVFLITTSGAGSSGHAARTMANTLRTWGVDIIGQRDFVTGALSTPEKISSRHEKAISAAARKIVSAGRESKTFRASFISLIFFTVQQRIWKRNKDDSLDYHYWESKGWLKPGVTYYIPHKTNPVVVLAARLAGSIISLFFE